jgi:hypothetical protein
VSVLQRCCRAIECGKQLTELVATGLANAKVVSTFGQFA